jgi:hypothetical protein
MTGRLPPGFLASCDKTGKRGYSDRKSARRARRYMMQLEGEKAAEWDIYRCQYCQMIHIGHRNPNYQ